MFGKNIVLGFGSNLGESINHFRAALAEIKRIPFLHVRDVSSLYESDAQLPENASETWNKKYLNAAVRIQLNTDTSPEILLQELKKIERAIGRIDSERWAPREIDIDILAWDDDAFSSPQLSIPHKRLCERPFALLPTLELMPELAERISLPEWSQGWVQEKPFATKICRDRVWSEIVGILNVTADWFSDGGSYLDENAIAARAKILLRDGADIIDVGAESTRPGAVGVTADEEWARVDLALSVLRNFKVRLSLDSRRPAVVGRAVEKYKIDFLNDVEGFAAPEMQRLLRDSGKKAFVMHSLSIPHTQTLVLSDRPSPSEQIREWWRQRREQLVDCGIGADRLVFDPGIGFGKTPTQNLFLLRNLQQFSAIRDSILIGHSRKSFLTMWSEQPAARRDPETAVLTSQLNQAYVQYLRVHDPASQKAALIGRIR